MSDPETELDPDERPDPQQDEEQGAPGAAVPDGGLADAPEPGEPG